MPAGKVDVHFRTPWITLISETLPNGDPYYMLELQDYVSVVALTVDERLLFVSQYRPVVGRQTLELPSGHVDAGETPEEAARRELVEETGYCAGDLELLGMLAPDVGRLRNRLWCFFAPEVRASTVPVPIEEGLSVRELSVQEAMTHATTGAVDHALNLAALFLAVAKGKFPLA